MIPPLCFPKLPPLSPCIPSPSSLMDLGSETAKHCMVSYFCGWGSCSCDSSWFSLWGLTSILQLNVWLFLLGPSLDHGTPFTTEEARRRSEGRFTMWLPGNFIAAKNLTTKREDWGAATSEPREDTMLQVEDIMRARQREWNRKKCKKRERVVAG